MTNIRDDFFNGRRLVKQWLFSNFVDHKHLNLGAFRSHSDIQVDIPLYKTKEQIDWGKYNEQLKQKYNPEIRLIYINIDLAHKLDNFLNYIYSSFTGTFVIDTLDISINSKPDWVGDFALWAAPHISNPKSSSGILLPLGVEERRRFDNNKPWLFSQQGSKCNCILVGPFAPTNPIRNIFKNPHHTHEIHVFTKRLAPYKYSRLAQQFKFTFCPPGNGIDTHRFWETLYRKSIPIVLRSEWSTHFLDQGIPLWEIDCVDELFDLRYDTLFEYYNERSRFFEIQPQILSNSFWIMKLRNLGK